MTSVSKSNYQNQGTSYNEDWVKTFTHNYFYVTGFPLHIEWNSSLLLTPPGLMKSGPCGPVQPSLSPLSKTLFITAQTHRSALSSCNREWSCLPQPFQTYGPWTGEGRRAKEKKPKRVPILPYLVGPFSSFRLGLNVSFSERLSGTPIQGGITPPIAVCLRTLFRALKCIYH